MNLTGYQKKSKNIYFMDTISVTRLGDLLEFGQDFKAFGNN